MAQVEIIQGVFMVLIMRRVAVSQSLALFKYVGTVIYSELPCLWEVHLDGPQQNFKQWGLFPGFIIQINVSNGLS